MTIKQMIFRIPEIIKEVFSAENGRWSSKRLAGAFLILVSVYCILYKIGDITLVSKMLILGCVLIGAGIADNVIDKLVGKI